jgi:hypothetical protein
LTVAEHAAGADNKTSSGSSALPCTPVKSKPADKEGKREYISPLKGDGWFKDLCAHRTQRCCAHSGRQLCLHPYNSKAKGAVLCHNPVPCRYHKLTKGAGSG